jgi:hypothetical protein
LAKPATTVVPALAFLAEAATAVIPTLTFLAEAATAFAPTTAGRSTIAAPFTPAAAIEGVLVLMRPQHAGQHCEATFLILGQALIKRRAGVGDLLERGAHLAHGVSATAQPIEWRRRLRLCLTLSLLLALSLLRLAVTLPLRLRLHRRLLPSGLPGQHALNAQLSHVVQGGLERRPILGLVRRQFEPGLERGDARVGKGGNVVGTQAMMLMFGAGTVTKPTTTVETLLRIHER